MHGEEIKARVISASRVVFSRSGYRGATVQEIIEEAGLPPKATGKNQKYHLDDLTSQLPTQISSILCTSGKIKPPGHLLGIRSFPWPRPGLVCQFQEILS